jgi:uncharacterized protein
MADPDLPDSTPELIDNVGARRFELHVDGELAGIVTYQTGPGRIVFVHTEVMPAFEGHGVGGRLAKAVLDVARERGLRVVARCPFIAEYIRRHPDYEDLLASA